MKKLFYAVSIILIIVTITSWKRVLEISNYSKDVPENVEMQLESKFYDYLDSYEEVYKEYIYVKTQFSYYGSEENAERITRPTFEKRADSVYQPFNKMLDSICYEYPEQRDRLILKFKKLKDEETRKREYVHYIQ